MRNRFNNEVNAFLKEIIFPILTFFIFYRAPRLPQNLNTNLLVKKLIDFLVYKKAPLVMKVEEGANQSSFKIADLSKANQTFFRLLRGWCFLRIGKSPDSIQFITVTFRGSRL